MCSAPSHPEISKAPNCTGDQPEFSDGHSQAPPSSSPWPLHTAQLSWAGLPEGTIFKHTFSADVQPFAPGATLHLCVSLSGGV